MRTKRRELKELRRRSSGGGAGEYVKIREFAEGRLGPAESYYELIKMIAGHGVGMAGNGLGMLRTRRRDISIKPNRKLDRKSSRGMIYENEELRLRTIHINAEVEQGQNDIKKLRRENEQLRREIWSLRDEYDKLEDILKKQKGVGEGGGAEDRSGDEVAGSEYSEEDDEDEEDDDDESETDDEAEAANDQEARLENAENQKISTEKSNSITTPHRTRINFDNLPVVEEEEEQKKDKEAREDAQLLSASQQLPYHTTSFEQMEPRTTTSFGYPTESCSFVFPTQGDSASCYSNSSQLLMTTYPDVLTHNSSSPTPLAANAPLPVGWQNGLSMPTTTESSPITVANFATAQPLARDPRIIPPKDLALEPGDNKVMENGQAIAAGFQAKFARIPSLAERRKAFFQQQSMSRSYGFNFDKPDASTSADNSYYERKNGFNGLLNYSKAIGEDTAEASVSNLTDGKPKHFFAPLLSKSRFLCNEEIYESNTAKQLDSPSSSSEQTTSTVISRSRYNQENGVVEVHVNGESKIEQGDAKAFFSSENLLAIDDRRAGSSNGSNNPLTKSISCQDLSSRLSFTENLNIDHQLAKSDNTLDNVSIGSKHFKSQLSVNLRQPGSRRSFSPDVPEIPKLPSIDYKLFNNPFLQNFEQAYQNFPLRTDGQSPVTHPLSIQVCESPVPVTSYSSPVRVQPSFSSPSMIDQDCTSCKRKDIEGRLRLIIPPNKLLDPKGDGQQFQVTSFETPSPHTLSIPPLTPYELEALRKMPTGTTSVQQNSRLYQNVPFVPRGAAVYCPGQGVKMCYDTSSLKVAAQTQTTPAEEIAPAPPEPDAKSPGTKTEVSQPTPEQPKKRRSRKEKSGSVKEKRRSPNSSVRRKELKKQNSVTSRDVPDSPGISSSKNRSIDAQDDKNESRSSSSGQDSPTKRVSLYFSTKKRPSLSSRTSRSRSVENAKHLTRAEASLDGVERERTNSISSREVTGREKTRKSSTSSGSVPWCACWGNGCV